MRGRFVCRLECPTKPLVPHLEPSLAVSHNGTQLAGIFHNGKTAIITEVPMNLFGWWSMILSLLVASAEALVYEKRLFAENSTPTTDHLFSFYP